MDDDLANPCDESEEMDCNMIESAGDLGPESIKFVSGEQSPNGMPLGLCRQWSERLGNCLSGGCWVNVIITLIKKYLEIKRLM